ncbi:MAG TPA: cupin domain-containing protein [Candidatus Binatia bacterium]
MSDLDAIERALEEKNLFGYWTVGSGAAYAEPKSSFEPCLWKWQDVQDALDRTGAELGLDQTFRRFIGFSTPALNKSTTHTLILGAQLVKPGEIAEAHRHTMGAIRFVIRGGGAQTTVDGEPFPMEAGDLITTPGGTWHDHYNGSAEPVIWLDGADRPIIKFFQIGFHEPFGERRQPLSRAVGATAHELGPLRPNGLAHNAGAFPAYRYKWEDALKALEVLGERPGDPHDGILLRYTHPLTGGPTLPTLSCELQMLRPGEQTESHRHTSTAVYHVFRGAGFTEIDDVRFDWQTGDSFTAPLWRRHRHGNTGRDEAVLFVMNDRPVLEALGFYREEAA